MTGYSIECARLASYCGVLSHDPCDRACAIPLRGPDAGRATEYRMRDARLRWFRARSTGAIARAPFMFGGLAQASLTEYRMRNARVRWSRLRATGASAFPTPLRACRRRSWLPTRLARAVALGTDHPSVQFRRRRCITSVAAVERIAVRCVTAARSRLRSQLFYYSVRSRTRR